MDVFIYALNDPVTGRCRYVGKSKDPLFRFYTHLTESRLRGRSHKNFWIKSLLRIGARPVLEILDQVPQNEWEFWEREYIRLFRMLGFDLTNETEGGDGGDWTPERRLRFSELTKGRIVSEETRKKLSAVRKGKAVVIDAPWRASMSAAKIGKKLSIEHRAAIAAGVSRSQRAQEALAAGRALRWKK